MRHRSNCSGQRTVPSVDPATRLRQYGSGHLRARLSERERADFLSPKEPRLTRSLKERLKKIGLTPERPSHRSEPVSRSNVPVHFSELNRSEPLTEVSRFAHL